VRTLSKPGFSLDLVAINRSLSQYSSGLLLSCRCKKVQFLVVWCGTSPGTIDMRHIDLLALLRLYLTSWSQVFPYDTKLSCTHDCRDFGLLGWYDLCLVSGFSIISWTSAWSLWADSRCWVSFYWSFLQKMQKSFLSYMLFPLLSALATGITGTKSAIWCYSGRSVRQ